MLVQNWQVVYILFLDAVLALSVNLFNEMLFCSVNKYTVMLIYLHCSRGKLHVKMCCKNDSLILTKTIRYTFSSLTTY